jgi:hypothetical protein
MKREVAYDMLPVIAAFACGKTIRWRRLGPEGWPWIYSTEHEPQWKVNYLYEVVTASNRSGAEVDKEESELYPELAGVRAATEEDLPTFCLHCHPRKGRLNWRGCCPRCGKNFFIDPPPLPWKVSEEGSDKTEEP